MPTSHRHLLLLCQAGVGGKDDVVRERESLGKYLDRYRRILSCAFVRATESCLLARLGHLDAGAREAAQRRQVTVREEERDRREEAAHFQAYVRGRGGARRGRLPE